MRNHFCWFFELTCKFFNETVFYFDLSTNSSLDLILFSFNAFSQSKVVILQHPDMCLQGLLLVFMHFYGVILSFFLLFNLLFKLKDLIFVLLYLFVVASLNIFFLCLAILLTFDDSEVTWLLLSWIRVVRVRSKWLIGRIRFSFFSRMLAARRDLVDLVLNQINLLAKVLRDFFQGKKLIRG